MQVNGAAARLVQRGDTIIVFSYAAYDEDDLARYEPRVVHVDADQRIVAIDDQVGTLLCLSRASVNRPSERSPIMSAAPHAPAPAAPVACR